MMSSLFGDPSEEPASATPHRCQLDAAVCRAVGWAGGESPVAQRIASLLTPDGMVLTGACGGRTTPCGAGLSPQISL